jgi:cytochrome c553
MKISRWIPVLLLASGLWLAAEEDPEFVAWMKGTGNSFNALNKMDSKTGEKAVRAAERMGSVYEEMIGFWRQRNRADAVAWSEEGKAAALELATAAYAGDNEKATAALNTLTGTCKQCHQKYREKVGENQYRMK